MSALLWESSRELLYANMGDLVNSLLRFSIKVIVTEERKVSDEYLRLVQELAEFYSNNGGLILDKDIIDSVVQMGSFGRSANSRKFCTYFCAILMKLANKAIPELVNRFMMLSVDTERPIKQEVAHNLSIIYTYFDEQSVRKNLYKIVIFS